MRKFAVLATFVFLFGIAGFAMAEDLDVSGNDLVGATKGGTAVNDSFASGNTLNTEIEVDKKVDVTKVDDGSQLGKTNTIIATEDSFNKKTEDSFNYEKKTEDSYNKKTEVEIEDSFNKNNEVEADGEGNAVGEQRLHRDRHRGAGKRIPCRRGEYYCWGHYHQLQQP